MLADEVEAYQATLEAVRRAESDELLDYDGRELLRQDLDRAYAAMETAWLERAAQR